MNSLSWLIYIMGLVDKFEFLLCVSLFLVAAGTAFWYMARGDTASWEQIGARTVRSGLLLAIIALILVVIPSRRTVTLIAASEVGERLLKTDAAQQTLNEIGGIGKDSVDLLKKYIEREMLDLNNEIDGKKGKRM